MKLSVVIPLYNKEKYIERCIISILEQSYESFEIIVVDDGSTDSSVDIVKNFTDSRIKLITKRNGGVSSARNKGILASTTDYVCFLDADDYWRDGVLTEYVRLIGIHTECSAFVVSSAFNSAGWNRHKETEAYLINDYYEQLSNDNVIINSSSICIKKGVFLTLGYFSEGIHHGEDGYMWAKIYSKFKIVKSSYLGSIYDKQATGRCANVYNPTHEHPLVSDYDKGIKYSDDLYYEWYITRLRKSFAKKWLLNGEKRKYNEAINKVVFKGPVEEFTYKIMIYMPTPILNFLYLRLRG